LAFPIFIVLSYAATDQFHISDAQTAFIILLNLAPSNSHRHTFVTGHSCIAVRKVCWCFRCM